MRITIKMKVIKIMIIIKKFKLTSKKNWIISKITTKFNKNSNNNNTSKYNNNHKRNKHIKTKICKETYIIMHFLMRKRIINQNISLLLEMEAKSKNINSFNLINF